jgi:hypothetical protein
LGFRPVGKAFPNSCPRVIVMAWPVAVVGGGLGKIT